MKQYLNSFMVIMTFSGAAFGFDVSQIPGEITYSNSPAGKQEMCVRANKILPSAYKDKDLKQEQELCNYDFYKNVALCPKLNSTNPGVLITEIIEGKTRTETMNMCSSKQSISVEAKFKNSITCSYTPSILAYYHFSRFLKAGNVPVAVLRTMDRTEHWNVAQRALKAVANNPSSVIYKTWSQFANAHNNLNNMDVFDNSKQFVYGALSDNPKKEFKYTEISGVGDYETRYERFLKQRPYLNVANPQNALDIAGSNDYKKSLQTILQMKDVSDMILLDTLFSQDDRIGNIHYKLAWYIPEQDEKTGELKFEVKNSKAQLSNDSKSWVIPQEEKNYSQIGGVLVREILMKDNDCGVNVAVRSNMMRKISAIEGVRHMSARTYRRFIDLYKVAKTTEFTNWMKAELQFKYADIKDPRKGFLANLDRAYSVLNTNCKNGSLKLDLNIDELIPGSTKQKVSCD